MTTTSHLGMTLVEQSQAQKEITVNQALTRVDAFLNNGAKSQSTSTPPGSPASGDLYIVGSSPTGAWTGQAGKLAYYDQGWYFVVPNEGAVLWVNDEDVAYSYNGTSWILTTQNLSKVGVNATADATNRLSVASDAVLFNHNGSGVQVKLNKNATANTASFLYQTGFSGRAEFGTIGDDSFTLKVSSEGTIWLNALKVVVVTGRVAFKSIATDISAAGSNQAGATALTKSINVVSTVSSGQGVLLPLPEAGELLLIANQSSNTLNVYPSSGHSINALSANVATTMGVDTRKLFFAATSSAWYAV